MSKQAIKLKKQKKREQDNKRQKLAEVQRRRELERRRLYRLQYPEFHFDTQDGDPAFVEVVKKSLATISFEDRTIFEPWEQELYRILKQHGIKTVNDQLQLLKMVCREAGSPNGQIAELRFMYDLGQAVFDRIPAAQREVYLPFNDVMLVPDGRRIAVIFRSLLTAKGRGGTVYYSRRRPTLDIDGESKVVAFSRHAIERICERIKPRWRVSYTALGDAFAYFDQCIYFEQCKLSDGQLGFTFYEECHEGYVQRWYVDDVLGEGNLDPRAGRPYYRIGYCPAVIEGNFIKATTLLFPGYRGTPEYDAIRRSPLPRGKKQEMIEQASRLDAATLFESRDLSLIRWFHEHGVSQVVELDRPVFASALRSRRVVP